MCGIAGFIYADRDKPVDPETLPADAVRLDDEFVIVQGIEIKPKNTKFQRHVFYSASQKKYYRGPLPAGSDGGDFNADLRALIVALKKYEGTLVFISHDVHFIRSLATKVLHVSAGKVTPYPGGYDYYLEKTGAEKDARAAVTAGGPLENQQVVSQVITGASQGQSLYKCTFSRRG